MMNGDASREVSFREREKPDQDGSEPAGDHQEDDLKWSCVRGEEASPEWSQSSSGPSSEGEEGEGESRTPSGYTLLPQDPEQINGYATGGGGAAPPEQDPEGSPRMTKWLQKQLKDMTVSTSTNTSSKTQTEHSTTDWAKFSEPVVSSESKDWPNVAIEERTTGATMTTGPVEPVSTMGEGIYMYTCLTIF